MHSIHAAKVGLWISIHNPQTGRPPCSAEVNPETPVVCKRVPDPLGMEAMLDDDDDSTAVVEIPDRDAAPLTPTDSRLFQMTSAFLRVYGGRGIPARRATLVMAFAIRTTCFGSRT